MGIVASKAHRYFSAGQKYEVHQKAPNNNYIIRNEGLGIKSNVDYQSTQSSSQTNVVIQSPERPDLINSQNEQMNGQYTALDIGENNDNLLAASSSSRTESIGDSPSPTGICTRLKKSISYVAPIIFSKENTLRITSGFILTGVNIGLNLFSPYLLGEIVNRFDSNESFELFSLRITPFALVITYGVSWTLINLSSNLRTFTLTPIAHKASRKLAYRYTAHIFNQSLDYHESVGQGGHFFPIQNIYNAIPNISTQLLTQLIPTITEVAIAIALISKLYGPEIIGIVAGLFVVYTSFNVITKNKVMATRDEINKYGNELFDLVSESMTNYKSVHMFNNAEHQLKKLEDKFKQFADISIKSDSVNAKTGIGQALILGVGFSLMCIIAARGVFSGKYNEGDFVTLMSYFSAFITPLSSFGTSVSQFYSALTQLEAAFNALEKRSSIADDFPNKSLNVDHNNAKIEFRNVSFSYVDGKPILDNVSFSVKAGDKVGIVGNSGAGKSTLGKLLFRFCDPTNGAILINEQDIRGVGLNSLRSTISIVPQETVLFNDTIYKNVEFGGLSLSEEMTEKHVKTALKTVGLWQYFNSLPKKLDTKVGEGGAQVSGGQRQRIGIARALLKNPKIFIFDEATSSLDNVAKNEVQQNIDKIWKERKTTSIVITHHLSSIMNADIIFVLSEGKIVEQGTHDTLLKNPESLYSKLWEKEGQLESNQYLSSAASKALPRPY